MTEEAPAGSSEGATWALRHRKALASALFVLAAIAALKVPGLRITALFVFLLGASLLVAEASPEATGVSEGGSAGDALGSLPGVRAVEAASRSDDEDASAYFRSLLSHHRSAAKVAWWGAVLAIWLGQVPAATVLALGWGGIVTIDPEGDEADEEGDRFGRSKTAPLSRRSVLGKCFFWLAIGAVLAHLYVVAAGLAITFVALLSADPTAAAAPSCKRAPPSPLLRASKAPSPLDASASRGLRRSLGWACLASLHLGLNFAHAAKATAEDQTANLALAGLGVFGLGAALASSIHAVCVARIRDKSAVLLRAPPGNDPQGLDTIPEGGGEEAAPANPFPSPRAASYRGLESSPLARSARSAGGLRGRRPDGARREAAA